VESILSAEGIIRNPAATPLWNNGQRFILGTISMWVSSTAAPRGVLPDKQSFGNGSGSVITGCIDLIVNIPLII